MWYRFVELEYSINCTYLQRYTIFCKIALTMHAGIKRQSERFPVRFIVELLSNRKCCIILTG